MSNEYIYGRIPVQECLQAKRRTPHCLYLQDGSKDVQDVYALAMAASIPVEKTSRKALARMTHDGVHQGVVLETAPLPVYKLEDWLADLHSPQAMVVILDSVEDPHNFGAIARTATGPAAEFVPWSLRSSRFSVSFAVARKLRRSMTTSVLPWARLLAAGPPGEVTVSPARTVVGKSRVAAHRSRRSTRAPPRPLR